MVAASSHTPTASARKPGTWTGRRAAAFATIPVPMTEANQFGPRWRKASLGRSSAPSSLRGRRGTKAGAAATVAGTGLMMGCEPPVSTCGSWNLAYAVASPMWLHAFQGGMRRSARSRPSGRRDRPLEPDPQRARRSFKRGSAATHRTQRSMELDARYWDHAECPGRDLGLDRALGKQREPLGEHSAF